MRKLRRFLRPRAERCEYCSQPLGSSHQHVLVRETGQVECACRACYLLFTSGTGDRLSIPERYARVHDLSGLTQLDVPVGVVFFQKSRGTLRALYPGPAGATESLLPVSLENSALETMEPEVEALLVRRDEAYLVPIDACYQLVGMIKKSWHGFTAEPRVVEEFFGQLRERAR